MTVKVNQKQILYQASQWGDNSEFRFWWQIFSQLSCAYGSIHVAGAKLDNRDELILAWCKGVALHRSELVTPSLYPSGMLERGRDDSK